ncbi:MAG: hypothetical protein R2823_09400 [Acidimicrobiia bacterium]
MKKKWSARFGVFAVFAMLATMLVVVPAAADPVDTGADIGGDGLNPEIVCKWELPDRDGNWNNGMQYSDDDAPNNDAGFPCHGEDPNMQYEQGWEVIQVKANAEDEPTEQWIELWSAVRGSTSVSAVDSVFWKIYHPDESLKIQVHGEHSDRSPQELGASFNQGTGEWNVSQGSMWYAASNQTGQIHPTTISSQQGIIARAVQNDLWLYEGAFGLSKHQPCGLYRVDNYATYLGFTTMTTNNINVLCFVQLEADFDSVNWESVTPGSTDWVYGDLIFDEGGQSPWPTVKNTGSGAMTLGIEFTPMYWEDEVEPTTKKITEFDGAFGINPDFLEYRDPIVAGQEAHFGREYYQVLCANEVGKLDLSIHPPVGLPGGHYSGDLFLYGHHTPNGEEYRSPCLNEHGIWDPPHVRFSQS